MDKREDSCRVNICSPREGYMRDEVRIILAILIGWGSVTFGFELLVGLFGSSPQGSILTATKLFNLPFHFWFTAQFLPLWFIILCIVFNILIDRLTLRQSRRRDRTYE